MHSEDGLEGLSLRGALGDLDVHIEVNVNNIAQMSRTCRECRLHTINGKPSGTST